MPDLVIELDRHDEDEPRSRPAKPRHGWIAVGLWVLCAFTLAWGGRPSPAVRQVTDISLASPDELVGLAGEIFVDEPGILTALDSQTAKPRWRVRTEMERHLLRHEGDLVVATGEVAPSGGARKVWSLAIHIGTGEVRWRLPGVVTIVGGLAVSHDADLTRPASPGRLTVNAAGDGRLLWAKDQVPRLHTVDFKRQTVLVLERTLGELTEYRVDNGDLVARTVVPSLVNANGLAYLEGAVVAFFTEGGVLVRRGSEFVTAPVFESGEREQTDCGSVWCVYSPQTYAISLVDKESGQVVSGDARWEAAIRTDSTIVGLDPDFGIAVRSVFVFDPVTRRSQQLSGWLPLGPRVDAHVVTWHGPLFLMSTTYPGRTYFAVAERGGVRVAGSVPMQPLTQCVATNYLVACRVDALTYRVWHPS